MLSSSRPVDNSTPVLVLKLVRNPFHHGVLGIIRSLGQWGIPVHAFHDDRCAPAALSRYARGALVWRRGAAVAEGTVEDLRKVARDIGGRPILIPTDDVSSVFVEDNASALGEAFVFPEQPQGLARALSSKREMYRLCKRMDVPTAETLFPQTRSDVERYAREMGFPIVVKAIDPLLLRQRPGAESVVIAHDTRELMQHYHRMEVPEEPNLMLQEYIPGGAESVWMFNGYFDQRSECLVGFTGQKLRQHPPHRGITTLGICRANPEVEQLTKQFLKAVGYRGIVDLGYRYDARDGRYKLLDVNPRIGTTFRLFVGTNGMDVARALYLDLTGQPVPETAPWEGRKWMVENFDCASALLYAREGTLSFPTWVRSFQGVQETAWFARDDPVPFFVMGARSAWKTLRRRPRVKPPARSQPATLVASA